MAVLFSSFVWLILIVVGACIASSMIVITRQQTSKIIETLGKFSKTTEPGLSFKAPWPFGAVVDVIDLRIMEFKDNPDVKTNNDAFVKFPVAVQYKVTNPTKACYELRNPETQLSSFVLNTVRTSAAGLSFNELYTEKDRIEREVFEALSEKIQDFGFKIVNVLVDEPVPDNSLKEASNDVLASERRKQAAINYAEADRERIVGKARAQREAKQLQGEGIALQRTAIASGIKESVDIMKHSTGLPEEMIMSIMMTTNHFDMIRDASQNPGTLILMPSSGSHANEETSKMAAIFKTMLDKSKESKVDHSNEYSVKELDEIDVDEDQLELDKNDENDKN